MMVAWYGMWVYYWAIKREIDIYFADS